MVQFAIYFYSVVLLVACGITSLWGDWTNWFPARDALGYGQDAAAGVALGLLIVLLSQSITARVPLGRKLTQEFALLFGPLTTGEVALLALSSGIAEEALFRSTLQPMMGLVFCSLLFGFLHIGHRKEYLVWTVFALAFGFVIGGVFAWRPGLVWPAATHITVNFFNMKWIVSHYKEASARQANPPASSQG